MRQLAIYQIEHVPYLEALTWQRQHVQHLIQDPTQVDRLLLVTHPPVYTLGQGADPTFLKFAPESSHHTVYRVERGGEVTYHGPGQWVAYPILSLHRHQKDLHWYLRQLEQVVINVLAQWNLKGERIKGLTGVWIEGTKVAAIGIRVTKWITFHGFSINVCPDLKAYQQIVPCGIADRPVGSMVQFCPDIMMELVGAAIINAFTEVFQYDRSTSHPFYLDPFYLDPTDTQ